MEPNWNLLPHQPRAFFGLEPSAQIRDLKRAYGRLIKRYKPDSHPTEFMRIGEAYEALESAMTYGFEGEAHERMGATPAEPAIDVTDSASNQPSLSDPKPAEHAFSLRKRPTLHLGKTPPSQTGDPYGERLLAFARSGGGMELPADLKPRKGEHFIQLAFYYETQGDREPVADEEIFFRTLAEGSKTFPHDPALHQCLRHFFARLTEGARIRRFLELAHWSLPPEVFFYLTEDAWFRLGEMEGGKIASELLEKLLQDELVTQGRAVFLQRFLLRHHDQVDPDWFESCLLDMQRFFEGESTTDNADVVDDDFVFLTNLLTFVRLSAAEVERYPIHDEIAKLLRIACGPEAAQRSTQVYRFFQRLGELDYACKNFAGPPEELWLYYRLLFDVLFQYLDIFNPADESRREAAYLGASLNRLGASIKAKLDAEPNQSEEQNKVADAAGMILGLLVGVAVFRQIGGDLSMTASIGRIIGAVLGGLLGAVVALVFLARTFRSKATRSQAEFDWDAYELIVRPVLINHLKEYKLTYSDLLSISQQEAGTRVLNQHREWICQFLQTDMSLAFHSLGLRVKLN